MRGFSGAAGAPRRLGGLALALSILPVVASMIMIIGGKFPPEKRESKS
jgi:hypothetical protein